LKRKLSEKYNVRGIPTLVVLNGDGTLISVNGRGDVQSKGPGALKEWM